jgi:hypothetical protein
MPTATRAASATPHGQAQPLVKTFVTAAATAETSTDNPAKKIRNATIITPRRASRAAVSLTLNGSLIAISQEPRLTVSSACWLSSFSQWRLNWIWSTLLDQN